MIVRTIRKKQHDYHAIERSLDVGDPVFCENFVRGDRWLQGCIIQKPGPLSYVIKLHDGRIIRRHHDHVVIRSSAEVSQDNIHDVNMIFPITLPVDTHVPLSIILSQPVAIESQPEPAVVTPIENCVPNIVPPGILRRSQRTIHIPGHLLVVL